MSTIVKSTTYMSTKKKEKNNKGNEPMQENFTRTSCPIAKVWKTLPNHQGQFTTAHKPKICTTYEPTEQLNNLGTIIKIMCTIFGKLPKL